MNKATTLRRQEIDEDVFVLSTCEFATTPAEVFENKYKSLCEQGKLRGQFDDSEWVGCSGLRTFSLDFHIRELLYAQHMKSRLTFSATQLERMLKCYALCLCGELVFHNIQGRINEIKRFLETYNSKTFHTTVTGKRAIIEFLEFVGMPMPKINEIGFGLPKDQDCNQRELQPLINYLVIADIIQKMYEDPNISDEEFIKWFPVFFWCKITFILPLRVTEMLLTPLDCIRRDGDSVYLTINRTLLKKRRHVVHYDPEKDYKPFEYKIPDTDTVMQIEKYIALTQGQSRKFLFQYDESSSNDLFSLASFTALLETFIDTFMVGNATYAYAKYACGITEFSYVNPGDSRILALSNMLFQDIGLDICRQLADHEHIETTYGYAVNVSKTIWASSVMSIQRKINLKRTEIEKEEQKCKTLLNKKTFVQGCGSPLQPKITGNIKDCVREGHIDIDECIGCRYHHPTNTEMAEEMSKRQKKLDETCRTVFDILSKHAKNEDRDLNKLLLDAQTAVCRYKISCNEEAKKKWQRFQNTATKCC